jgi:hypothetical protein
MLFDVNCFSIKFLSLIKKLVSQMSQQSKPELIIYRYILFQNFGFLLRVSDRNFQKVGTQKDKNPILLKVKMFFCFLYFCS